jgi:predicted cation transporter
MNPYARLQSKSNTPSEYSLGWELLYHIPNSQFISWNFEFSFLECGIKPESSEVLFVVLLISSSFTARLCRAHEITVRVGLGTLVVSISLTIYLLDRQTPYDLSTPREDILCG